MVREDSEKSRAARVRSNIENWQRVRFFGIRKAVGLRPPAACRQLMVRESVDLSRGYASMFRQRLHLPHFSADRTSHGSAGCFHTATAKAVRVSWSDMEAARLKTEPLTPSHCESTVLKPVNVLVAFHISRKFVT